MKKFYGFNFEPANLAALPNLTLGSTLGDYDFYSSGESLFLHDKPNALLFKIKTRRKPSGTTFHNDAIQEYEFAFHVKWHGAIANKQKLTVEDAKFIFEQSEKYLKDSIDTSAIILARVNTIVAIIAAIIIGLTSYIVSEYRKTCDFDNVLITSTIGVIYFYILGYFAARNILPNLYFPVGSLPKDLFEDAFFQDAIPKEQRIIQYYVNEFENYQFRIGRNNYINGERWTLYKRTLLGLLFAPIVLFAAYGILFIFRSS